MQTIPKEKFEIIGVEPGAERIARPQVGYLKDVWRRFRKNKLAIVAPVSYTHLTLPTNSRV